jgi:hypothetical protein
VDWQSASLPGIEPDSSNDLRRASLRACCAAMRARAAWDALVMIVFASAGLRSNQSAIRSFATFCTKLFMSVLPSFVFVWPSNCGFCNFTEMIAARPSRMSSPDSFSSFLSSFFSAPYRLTVFVSAARKPSSCVPPSWVLIALANVYTDSPYDSFHCMAISSAMPSSCASDSNMITDLWIGVLVLFRWRTKSAMPFSYMNVTRRGLPSSSADPGRSSVRWMVTPLFRNAISWIRR